MKKILLLPLMVLTALSVVPNNEVKSVSAEETETIKVEEGYITKNLVDKEKGYVDLSNQSHHDEVISYYNNARSGDFQVLEWNTTLMNSIFENKTQVDGEEFVKATDSKNKLKVSNKITPYLNDGGGTAYTLISEKVSMNMVFNDWDTSKEQPIEFVYNLDSDLYRDTLLEMLDFFTKYIEEDFTLPLLTIDGETIIELVKSNNSYNFKNYNSRVYLGHSSDVEENEYYTGQFFVEIPFRNYIQTIEMTLFNMWSDEERDGTEPVDWLVGSGLYLDPTAASNSIFSPFNFSNLDFRKGQLTAVSADRATKIETAFGYISDYYNLDYIIINNDTLVYTKPTGKYYLDNGREQIYELYLDNAFKNPFNYDCDNVFVNKLKSATEDIDFNITYYSYSLVFENTELRENLRDILDDTLRPSGYIKPSISEKDLQEKIGIAPSPIIKQPKTLRRATSSSQVSNAVVDCGLFYVFRYNTEFSIHTLEIKATTWYDKIFNRVKNSFLNFEVSDASIGLNVSKINGLMFYYSVPEEDFNTKHSLSMVSGDIEVDSSKDLVFFNKDNYIIKKDKFGYKFYLGPSTIMDWNILHQVNVGESFTLSVEGNIQFENITSVIYTSGVGEIINLSGLSNTWGKGYTGVIKEDGTIIIIDKDGNTHTGYHFDPDTGILKDTLGNEIDSPVVPKPTNPWDKILKPLKQIASVVCTVAVVAAIVWCISKIGPTLAIVFTNSKHNRKQKKRRRK